jgi:hypothetical protein
MPGYDRRGPRGEGPLTGRGLGRCGGSPPDYWWRGRGRGRGGGGGFGRGGGRGYGWGRGFRGGRGGGGRWGYGGGGFGRGRGAWWWDEPDWYDEAPPLEPDDELALLKRDQDYFQQALKAIRDRIAALQKKD